ncbi:hypothetical protein NQZ68_001289 [Dissostichus eleginoides]|nr:hypothetical protein NQZ68_001289 [Dissostichus eleginoides]
MPNAKSISEVKASSQDDSGVDGFIVVWAAEDRMRVSWEEKQRRLLAPLRLSELQRSTGSSRSYETCEEVNAVPIIAGPPAVQLNPRESCPLIQLIDFAVNSHSLLNARSILCSLSFSSTSLRALDGRRTVIARRPSSTLIGILPQCLAGESSHQHSGEVKSRTEGEFPEILIIMYCSTMFPSSMDEECLWYQLSVSRGVRLGSLLAGERMKFPVMTSLSLPFTAVREHNDTRATFETHPNSALLGLVTTITPT